MTSLATSPALSSSQSWVERHFSSLLLAIAAAGIIPCVIYAKVQFLEFDAWWHLFTATQDRWLIFLGDWKYDAHPPLYYLLLRFVSELGHSHLILRSIDIVFGAAGSYAFGIVAARIFRYKVSALLAAAAYTFSMNMVEINCDVRSYPLGLLFLLLVLNAYLDFVRDPAGARSGRTILRFGIFSLLAILSEYYVVFFLVACLGILILRVLIRPAFRAGFLTSLRRDWKEWLFSSASTAAVFLTLFLFHMGNQVDLGYLKQYFWDENAPLSLDVFLLSNLEEEISYFSPFKLNPDLMLVLAAVLILVLIYFAFVRKDRWRGIFSASPPLMLAIILAQLVVLSLAARYPFGGEWRHQSIIAPFVFLTAFLALDLLAGAVKLSLLRNAMFAGVGLLAAASFVYGWVSYPWDSVEPLSAEWARFHATFPSPQAVYADSTAQVVFYSQTNRSKWIFQDRFLVNGERIAVYQVDDGSGHPIRFFKNKHIPHFDLRDLEMYQVLAGTLRHDNLKSAVLFYEGLRWDPKGVRLLEDMFRNLAPQAGLDYGRYSIGTSYAFIEFKLR